MTIEFKYNLKQRVMIKEIQRPGIIEIMQVDSLGVMYRVACWDNSERKTVWLYEDELESR